eukprot:9921823-Ditylum_brightwellii.AAC.1
MTLSKIFLLICKKVHNQDCLVDAELDDNAAMPSITCREDVLHILQSLWYWNYAMKLPTNSVMCKAACHPAQSVEAHTWCQDIHS